MKQSMLRQYEEGSAELVVVHAQRQRSRGKAPSMPFILERNPRKALVLAESVIRAAARTQLIDSIGAVVTKGKTYDEMTDAEIKVAVRSIISTSSSEDEVRRRLEEELKYPFDIALHTSIPDDATGREARELVRGLGGLVMKNGAMAMAMVHGHSGVISL